MTFLFARISRFATNYFDFTTFDAMKNTAFCLAAILFLIANSSYAQSEYKTGYLVLSEGDTLNGFVLEEGWSQNPTKIWFKPTEDGEISQYKVDEVKFVTTGRYTFEKHTVEIGKPKMKIEEYDHVRKLPTETKTVLLNRLVDGPIKLFLYSTGVKVFLLQNRSMDKPVQLIYKPYKTAENRIMYNRTYRSQLLEIIGSDKVDFDEVQKIEYDEKAISKMVIKANEELGYQYEVTKKLDEDVISRFGIYAGVGLLSDPVSRVARKSTLQAESFIIGVQYESSFNRTKNKLGFGVRLDYQKFNKKEVVPLAIPRTLKITYSPISISGLLKYRIFLSKNTYIGLTGGVIGAITVGEYEHQHDRTDFAKDANKFRTGYLVGLEVSHKRFQGFVQLDRSFSANSDLSKTRTVMNVTRIGLCYYFKKW